MSAGSIRRIHLLGFVEEVRHIHANMPDRRFCFVLGAGASKTSLIPTAGELGVEWLKKIHIERGGDVGDLAKWLSEGAHGIAELPPKTSITDIAAVAAAYPAIYHAKWGHDRAQGHAEIERHIEAARPSYGYYALAEILASDDLANPSRHNVVITPNFDNLPAETLGALGKKIPIVIGHSAITDFARPTLRRPLIIKFHHDFLLAPKSDPKDVGSLPPTREEACELIESAPEMQSAMCFRSHAGNSTRPRSTTFPRWGLSFMRAVDVLGVDFGCGLADAEMTDFAKFALGFAAQRDRGSCCAQVAQAGTIAVVAHDGFEGFFRFGPDPGQLQRLPRVSVTRTSFRSPRRRPGREGRRGLRSG